MSGSLSSHELSNGNTLCNSGFRRYVHGLRQPVLCRAQKRVAGLCLQGNDPGHKLLCVCFTICHQSSGVYCFPVLTLIQHPPLYRHWEAAKTLLKNCVVFKVHLAVYEQSINIRKGISNIYSLFIFFNSGSHLLSRTVSSKVPSAVQVLTIVFGMGTGVSQGRIATRNIY